VTDWSDLAVVGASAGGLKGTSSALQKADTDKVAKSIEASADSISKQVNGVEKAVKKAALENVQIKQQQLASSLHKDQLSTEDVSLFCSLNCSVRMLVLMRMVSGVAERRKDEGLCPCGSNAQEGVHLSLIRAALS